MTVSRRDLLSLMLGAPVAAHACRKQRSFPGQVRGAAHRVGHRLRDAVLERASGKEGRIRVAIVGAGPAGLSAGWRLARAGFHEYRIFDLEPAPGGTSSYGEDGVVSYPWGAHYVPLPLPENRALSVLLAEMGVLETEARGEAREHFRIREPEERIFYDGRWHAGLFPAQPGSPEAVELTRFEQQVRHWADFRDSRGRRAFALPMRLSSDDSRVTKLDQVPAARWLADLGIRSERVLWYLELACRDDYGLDLDHTSAWALLFYFCSRRPRGAAETQPFVSWPEGNGRLVQHLVARSKRQLQTGRLVTDVAPSDAHVRLAVLDVASNTLQAWRAEHVILALPQFVAARVLRPWRQAPPKHLAAMSYGAWLVANLHLQRQPESEGFPRAWDNVLYDSPSLGYVSAGHQALRDVGPDVWTYYLPFTGADPKLDRQRLLELDHQAWCQAIVKDLSRAHANLAEVIERIDIYKWGHAMVRPTLNFLRAKAQLERELQRVPRVHFAHSDLSGIALFEEAQDHGVRAAEQVLEHLGRLDSPLAG